MNNYNMQHTGEELDEAINEVLTGNVEKKSNKITQLSSSNTDEQYPSAKAVYNTIPKNLSDLNEDNNHRTITDLDKETWNNKSNFSGNYNDLINKPIIPDVNNFITKDVEDLTYYYTKTEINNKISAVYKYKGTVATYNSLPDTNLTIGDVYNVETDGSNYAWTGTIWDKLGGDIDLSGYQEKINSTHKINADLVDDTSTTNKFVTVNDKATWEAKYDKPNEGIPFTDLSSAVQASLDKADTALQSHQDISGKENTSNKISSWQATPDNNHYPTEKLVKDNLDKQYNDYYFSMPKKIYCKKDVELKMYLNNIITSNYLLRWGQYTNSTTIRNYDDYISLTGTAKASKNIEYKTYDKHLNQLESGNTNIIINDTPPLNQIMLMMGDSFITQGYIESNLRNLFINDNKTLTLVGSKAPSSSSLNKHEGHAGWKYTDFIINKDSENPFWDGEKFNFEYYVNNSLGGDPLDSVYLQLGTNDCSASTPNQNLDASINAAQEIINSILTYDNNIKIYLGLTVMPSLDSVKFATLYNGIGFNWIMRSNMQKLNKLLIETFSNNNLIKIVANNLVLDSVNDIRDNVHPTEEGYLKIAKQLYYTMMS